MQLFHLVIHQWRRRPGRVLLSLASISLAVATVLSVALAQTGVRASYQLLLGTVAGQPSLEILASAGGTFPEAELSELNQVPNVTSVLRSLVRPTMARYQGKRFRTLLVGLPGAEGSDEVERGWEELRFVSGGQPLEENQVVVGEDMAVGLGVELGARLIIVTRRGPRSVFVSGIATTTSFRDLAAGSSMAVPLVALRQWFAQDEELSRVRLAFENREDREAAREFLAGRLPDSLAVQTAHDHAELANNMLRSTELAVRFAGALSVVLAIFIVVNTLRMNFGERRRDLAVVRVLGATSSQIATMQLLEGAVLGLASVVVGLPAGVGLGIGLSHLMQGILGVDLPPPTLPWLTMAAMVPLGPLVGCLGACVPALAARNVSPREALGEPEIRGGEHSPRWSMVSAAAAWGGSVSLLTFVVTERASAEWAVPAGLLMLAAFVVLIPALLLPSLRGTLWLFANRTRIESELAIEQLLKRPTRTGLTVGACVVAVSGGLGLGTAIGNHVEAIHNWQQRTMAGDLMLQDPSASEDVGTVVDRDDVQRNLRADPRISRVNEQHYLASRVAGRLAMCVVRDLDEDVPLPWTSPTRGEIELRQAFASGDLVIGKPLARLANIEVGDVVTFELRGQTFARRVAEVVDDYHLGGVVAFVAADWARQHLDLGPPQLYLLTLNDPADADAVQESLAPLARSEGMVLESFSQLRQKSDRVIQGITGGLWTLFVVGFVVSGMGVANTLTMNILEQSRELGLFRMLGMTREQTGKLVLWEAVGIGLFGSLLGTVAGLTTAWVIHLCNEPLLGQSVPFSVSLYLLLANLLACWLIALLAAWWPVRIVRDLDLATAIAEE